MGFPNNFTYLTIQRSLSSAASLIVREAGGVVVDPTGGNFDVMKRRILCGSSSALISRILPLLTHVDYESEAVSL